MLLMQKKFSFLFVRLFLFASVIVACSDDGSSAKDPGESAKETAQESAKEDGLDTYESAKDDELDSDSYEDAIIDSILGPARFFDVQFIYAPGEYNGIWYLGDRWHFKIDSTVELGEYVRDLRLQISFADTATCNYLNTRVLVDGKELECSPDGADFGRCKDFLPSLTETHRLEVLLDSAKCGNLKKRYTIVPSKKPGSAWNTSGECYSGCERVALNSFFVELGGEFGGERAYSLELDTLQSRCYLKHGSDSLDLVKEFEPNYDFWNADHYRRMVVSADSASLAGLMQGDTLATLACAVIYQPWYIHQQLDSIEFFEREVNIQSYQRKRLISVGFTEEGSLELGYADRFPRDIYIRANVNGVHKYYYQHFFFDREYGSRGFYYEVPLDSIYGGFASSEKDSIQFIVMGNADAGSTIEEKNIRGILDHLPYIYLNDVFVTGFTDSTAAVLDSIIDVITDDAGNIKPEFFFIDAQRIPGYEKE